MGRSSEEYILRRQWDVERREFALEEERQFGNLYAKDRLPVEEKPTGETAHKPKNDEVNSGKSLL